MAKGNGLTLQDAFFSILLESVTRGASSASMPGMIAMTPNAVRLLPQDVAAWANSLSRAMCVHDDFSTVIARPSPTCAVTSSPTRTAEMSTFFPALKVLVVPSGSWNVTLCLLASTAMTLAVVSVVSTTTAPGFAPTGASATALPLVPIGDPPLPMETASSSVKTALTWSPIWSWPKLTTSGPALYDVL